MPVSVISWKSAPNVLAFRFPQSDFTTLSQLVVEESQEALVAVGGRFEGPFAAGTYSLNTKNFPFLEKFVNANFLGGKSPFAADVYFVQKSYSLDLKWGTPSAVQVLDPVYKIMLPVRAFGQYGIAIKNSRKFLTKLAGAISAFTTVTLGEHFRAMLIMEIKTAIGQYISQKNVSILDLAAFQSELAECVNARLAEAFDEFGLEFKRFAIASIGTDEDDRAVLKLRDALAQRAEMNIVGFNYQQMRSFDTLQTAAGNEGAGGMSSNLMGAGMGLALGAGLGGAFAGSALQAGTQAGIAQGIVCPKCSANNPAGTKFCSNCGNALNVSQTNSAPTQKCPYCSADVPAASKFCPNCGQKMKLVCAKCGVEVAPGTKFCPECGEKF